MNARRLVLWTAHAALLSFACGDGEVTVRNTDDLEDLFRSGQTKAHRGTKLIGEDCLVGSECESGSCLGGVNICSLSCAAAGCPLTSLDGSRLWPTICVPAPDGSSVCLRTCLDDGTCPSAQTHCEPANPYLSACFPGLPATPPPPPSPIGGECSGGDCEVCLSGTTFPRGLCTADCSSAPCPEGSVCSEYFFGGEMHLYCLAGCAPGGACATEGVSCQQEPSGDWVCR